MSLRKKRSLSENRATTRVKQELAANETPEFATSQQGHPTLLYQANGLQTRMGRRKTSSELISEAKCHLDSVAMKKENKVDGRAAGGMRLVNTRRPITPREPGRSLYGQDKLAGRLPSAYSMRYLQSENNRMPVSPVLPSLEFFKNQVSCDSSASETENLQSKCLSRRSYSLDSHMDFYQGGSSVPAKAAARKLPALEVKGVGLLGKPECIANDTAIDDVQRPQTAQTDETDPGGSTIPSTHTITANLLTSRKLFARSNNLLAQSSTERLIELLKDHNGLKSCTSETVNHINSILVELYRRVYKHEKKFKRGLILSGVYGLVESTSPKILLSVARVVLALRVTGSNLTGACKLVFKVARNEQNDYLFHDNDLLELLVDGLGRASPLDDPEACIYGYGSIRFLASSKGQERNESIADRDANKTWSDCFEGDESDHVGGTEHSDKQKLTAQNSLVARLAQHGAVELMVLHLQILNERGAAQKLSGPPLHCLYQLSAALRALADVHQTLYGLVEQSELTYDSPCVDSLRLATACPHLVRAAEVSLGEVDVQLNIVRTLSLLSEDDVCCEVLKAFAPRLGMLLGSCCEACNPRPDKAISFYIRLCYVLGNIMAKHDSARLEFFNNDVAMQNLVSVMDVSSNVPIMWANSLGDTTANFLIKMIRVVANMGVNPEVGLGLGHIKKLGTTLLRLVNIINTVELRNMNAEFQELASALMTALHNLCYYQQTHQQPKEQVCDSAGSLKSVLPDLATELGVTLTTSFDERIQEEAARVLGNLTLNERARRSFVHTAGLRIVLRLLSARPRPSRDLMICSLGILINLLGDRKNCSLFTELSGTPLLVDLLKHSIVRRDWMLATIECQALWNQYINGRDSCSAEEDNLFVEVYSLLTENMSQEITRQDDDDDSVDAWEDFFNVVSDLLETWQQEFSDDRNGEEDIADPLTDADADGDGDDEKEVFIA